jgi:hypothetical protein
MDEGSFERLVAAMCLCVGIESLVVLRDVYDLKAQEAEEVVGGLPSRSLESAWAKTPTASAARRATSDQRSALLIHRMILVPLPGMMPHFNLPVQLTRYGCLASVSLPGASSSHAAARKKVPKASMPVG